jgi:hypothetical protein
MRRPSADTVAGNGAPLNTRCAPPSADAVAGNEAQSPKQIIVHSLGLCKFLASSCCVQSTGKIVYDTLQYGANLLCYSWRARRH